MHVQNYNSLKFLSYTQHLCSQRDLKTMSSFYLLSDHIGNIFGILIFYDLDFVNTEHKPMTSYIDTNLQLYLYKMII